jgi:hypothetical protein
MTRHSVLEPPSNSNAEPLSRSPTPTIPTPPSEASAVNPNPSPNPPKRRPSPINPDPRGVGSQGGIGGGDLRFEEDRDDSEPGSPDTRVIMSTRSPLPRSSDGLAKTPLLKEERGRPSYDPGPGGEEPDQVQRSTFRSRSPSHAAAAATRKKYIYASLFLLLSLASFAVQTETAVYIQKDLGWNKAYCMLSDVPRREEPLRPRLLTWLFLVLVGSRTAHGRCCGLSSFSSCGSKSGGIRGPPSGRGTSTSFGPPPKWSERESST